MPRIFDNIEKSLLPTLRDTLQISQRADFCVGYFNLRGWRKIDDQIEQFSGGLASCCRLLVGMQRLPKDEVHLSLRLSQEDIGIDNSGVIRYKKQIAQEFCEQLTWGAPTNQDEAGLRRLSRQIKSQKVIVKLFLRYPLHAKLYLIHRNDINNPTIGFLGSSNLTLSGLQHQGELNIDVLDHDACQKLQKWFNDRWDDRWCIDISQELVEIIDNIRLFVPEDKDLGIRPEKLLSELGGEIEFSRKYQAPVRSLAAFEKSEYPDDWRELMRLYMVRRTRSFIQVNYAQDDPPNPIKKGEKNLTTQPPSLQGKGENNSYFLE